MALTHCRECNTEVSDQAATCPHCGIANPVGQAPPQIVAAPTKPRSKGPSGCLVLVIAIVGVLILLGIFGQSGDRTPTTPGCANDWQKCSDNADLVNNYHDWGGVKVACKMAANERAKYGTPEWPWFAFGTFLKGTDYVSTGMVTAIEPDAQFSNGFGAMVHSRVTCRYDLRSKKVIDVDITARF